MFMGITSASAPESGSLKPGRGNTGVEYRYYKTKEYNKLSKEQKDELREHRKEQPELYPKSNSNNDGRGKSGGSLKKKFKAQVASVVKELKKSEEKKDSELSDLKSFISSLIGDGQHNIEIKDIFFIIQYLTIINICNKY